MSKFKCTLWPSGEVLEFSGEETLLNELKKAGKKFKAAAEAVPLVVIAWW